jgi:hypothetical protein
LITVLLDNMKKLTWKKRQYDDLTIWTADVKTVGWQFAIEKNVNGYQPFVYYGKGEDIPLVFDGFATKNLKNAQDICNRWLQDIVIGLNKWI